MTSCGCCWRWKCLLFADCFFILGSHERIIKHQMESQVTLFSFFVGESIETMRCRFEARADTGAATDDGERPQSKGVSWVSWWLRLVGAYFQGSSSLAYGCTFCNNG